ncbi:YdcF family protein [Gordonia sp. VNK21]|uniref:YdcF family protein n=1 Tax=Gordonia sp. VNK21 TaxID=3382483 RepID=UPI0038D4F85F
MTIATICFALLAAAAWAISIRRIVVEPRQTGHGLALLGSLTLTWIFLVLLIGATIHDDEWSSLTVLAPIALGLLVLLLAGLALLANSVVVVRREGLRVATLVPAVFGLFLLIVLVATVVTAVVLVQTESAWQIAVLIPLVVIPIAMIVVALAGYTGYAALYGRRRPPAHTDAVVVLGAGLSGEDLTPLLAARVDRGIEVSASAVTADGRPPLLVLSGGKGSDEVISEAEAMRRYALAHGVPAERLVLEDTSTTTEENLRNTRAVLAERGLTDPELTVVTSNFHTLRSSSLTRRLGLRASVVGAATARYYVPAAFLREFTACLVHYRRANLLCWLGASTAVWAVLGLALYLGSRQTEVVDAFLR